MLLLLFFFFLEFQNGEGSSADLSEGDFFECDGESVGPSWFCTRQELDSNLRLKMLHLRDKKVPEFQRLPRIPALSSQILRSTVQVRRNYN